MRAKNKNDVYKLVAYNVKKYRKKKGITQAQLAEVSGYSYEYVRRIEAPNCSNNFSVNTISILANALEIDIRDLFDPYGEDEEDNSVED